MATKITGLTALTDISNDDLFVVVNDPSGTPATRKITVGDLFGNVTMNVAVTGTTTLTGNTTTTNLHITYDTTPTSSTDAVTKGKIWFDSNYIYVATANSNIKRVALQAF